MVTQDAPAPWAFRFRIIHLFDACLATALAAWVVVNPSLVHLLLVQAIIGLGVGWWQRNLPAAAKWGLVASFSLTALIGLFWEVDYFRYRLEVYHSEGIPIFEDGPVIELVSFPLIGLGLYGGIGCVVGGIAGALGHTLRDVFLHLRWVTPDG